MSLGACEIRTDTKGRELTEHGTAWFPIASYHDNLMEKAVPWHWHDELEAIVVVEGSAVITAGSGKYVVTEGNGFLINTGILHAAEALDGGKCHIHSIVFHPRLVGGSLDSVFWQKYLQPLLTNSSLESCVLSKETDWQWEIMEGIEEAWQCCVAEPQGYEFRVREALSKIIFLLSKNQAVGESKLSEKALRDGERIKWMLQYIQENHEGEITTSMIAASAMISESECLRCFRSTIGTTPIQYLKKYRIQRAAELLANTDEKIMDIGIRCGFHDMSYFARTFQQIKGCTPKEYRVKK